MRHIAPIDCIVVIAARSVCIAKYKAKHVSSIDHGSEVIDLRCVGRIPRAIEDSAVLLRAWDWALWPNEGKVSQIHCGPKSDEKQKSRGICARHGSYVVGVRVSSRSLISEEGSSTATAD